MKVDREEAAKIFDAIDTICMTCDEDMSYSPCTCHNANCFIRKLYNSLEFPEDY